MYLPRCNSVLLLFVVLVASSCTDSGPRPLPHLYIQPLEPIGWEVKTEATLQETRLGDTISLPARLKYRGGSSSQYWKHSYRVELDKAYPLCGLPNEDDWVLNASYVDKTFMRHRLSFDLFRAMNPRHNVAPQCRYVELTANGDYVGVYILMERVNGSLVGLDKSDAAAALYKDPPIFRESIIAKETNPELYEQRWPKPLHRDMTAPLDDFRDYIHRSSDEVFKSEIDEWVDLDNIIDWHLLLLLTNNGDGILKNFYLYKTGSRAPYRIAIWDYDHSYGRDGDYEINMLDRMLDPRRNVLLRRLLDTDAEDYSQRLAQRWQELRDDDWQLESLYQRIDAMDSELSLALPRQNGRWPLDDERWYDDANTHEMEVDTIRKYLRLRIDQLDERFMHAP